MHALHHYTCIICCLLQQKENLTSTLTSYAYVLFAEALSTQRPYYNISSLCCLVKGISGEGRWHNYQILLTNTWQDICNDDLATMNGRKIAELDVLHKNTSH